jgi:hypothetical protein
VVKARHWILWLDLKIDKFDQDFSENDINKSILDQISDEKQDSRLNDGQLCDEIEKESESLLNFITFSR